ncbi:DEP domain-containing mTOR-interacting protein-like [Mantella aurantiaca]
MELLSSSIQQKAENFQRKAEITLAGDQLRLRLYNAKLIRDRCKNTFTYPHSFVANEVLDWLMERNEAPDRETAMNIMQKFHECNLIHHVCDQYPVYKDAKLFYRFRSDDGTSIPTQQMKVMVRTRRIFETLNEDSSIVQVREEDSKRYRRTFFSSQILDWMVKSGEVRSRADGVALCRSMLECGLVKHVSGLHHFSDSEMLYQFRVNFRRHRKLIEILAETPPWQESPDSPFCLRKLGAELPQGSFACASDPIPVPRPSVKRSGLGVLNYTHHLAASKPMGLPSVLKHPVTVEELLAPGAPYIRKTITVMGDDVGWGLVIRGTGPCHVQAVDPGGPAAIAGIKIRQFVRSVNGINCLNLPYQTIYKHIAAGPRKLIVEVLEPLD